MTAKILQLPTKGKVPAVAKDNSRELVWDSAHRAYEQIEEDAKHILKTRDPNHPALDTREGQLALQAVVFEISKAGGDLILTKAKSLLGTSKKPEDTS